MAKPSSRAAPRNALSPSALPSRKPSITGTRSSAPMPAIVTFLLRMSGRRRKGHQAPKITRGGCRKTWTQSWKRSNPISRFKEIVIRGRLSRLLTNGCRLYSQWWKIICSGISHTPNRKLIYFLASSLRPRRLSERLCRDGRRRSRQS
jgi:hypothetical protein